MRSVILRSLAVIAIGGVVLTALLYVASTVDARPPQVVEVSLTQALPDDDEVALVTTSIEVLFSEPVDERTAAGAFEIQPDVDGAVSWSGSTMIFTPREPLELETRYRVEVDDGVRDPAGNEMTEMPEPFEFETSGRPSLTRSTPADGAEDVPLEEPIALTFSSLMDTASVERALRLSPRFSHELRWSGPVLEIVPAEPLRPGMEYEVTVDADASDVAGVAIGSPIAVRFTTLAPGLAVEQMVPADGIDGVAQTSPIAVFFDRPVDPDTVSGDLLTITPDLAGSLELVGPDGEAADDDGGTLLRFTPSGPMPPNTTFEVTLELGAAAIDGGRLARETTWTFTTGAPVAAISNQISFISDRSGVPNVWAMNPDGTGRRQLSAELTPVLDYAIAPDGSSLVVGDGRRLVYQRADGSDRRVLTAGAVIDFDPAYAPDSQRLAFGRANAETGAGLGLFEWEIGAGRPESIALPDEPDEGPAASGGDELPLRAPRWSPNGEAIAFVDLTGSVGILELDEERLLRVPFAAADVPAWLPDGASLLLTGAEDGAGAPPGFEAPVEPLAPAAGDEIVRLVRARESLSETPYDAGSRVLAVSRDGEIAYAGPDGRLHLTDLPNTANAEPIVADATVVGAAFAPGEPAMAIVTLDDDGEPAIELLDLESGERTVLVEGSRPRWLP